MLHDEAFELERILNAGLRAPSGDNLQPWRFVASDESIDVFLVQERTHNVYDYKKAGSLVATGTAIENLLIASAGAGRFTELTLYPNPGNPLHLAHILFRKGGRDENLGSELRRLESFIYTRNTNRNPYRDDELSKEQQREFQNIVEQSSIRGRLSMVGDPTRKRQLAKHLSFNERLIFTNRCLHNALYRNIRWTRREVRRSRDGLDIRSLELPVVERFLFACMRPWPVAWLLSWFGAAAISARRSERVFARSGALGAIIMDGATEQDLVNSGRLMERIWLAATGMGLSMQPAFFFVTVGLRKNGNDLDIFSKTQAQRAVASFREINNLFEVGEGAITMLFRIGTALEPPGSKSVRMYPETMINYRKGEPASK